MIQIHLIHNEGAGFSGPVVVEDGTRVVDLFRKELRPDADPGRFIIQLNRHPVDWNEPLKEGDKLIFAPSPMEGADSRKEEAEDLLTKNFMAPSEGAFQKVWDNPDDAQYDSDMGSIKAAIARLPGKAIAELLIWLDGYHEQVWDKQIEEDLDAGRLDALIAEADRDYEAGLFRPL